LFNISYLNKLKISSATALANFASILLKNSEAKSNVTELGFNFI